MNYWEYDLLSWLWRTLRMRQRLQAKYRSPNKYEFFDMLNKVVCIYILNFLHTNFNFTEKNYSSNLFNISWKVRVSWRCVLHVLLTSLHHLLQSTLHILYIIILQQPLQLSELAVWTCWRVVYRTSGVWVSLQHCYSTWLQFYIVQPELFIHCNQPKEPRV